MIATHFRDRERVRVTPAGLRVPGTLARWPLIGLFMVLSGGLIFGALAYNLQIQGPLIKWDIFIANYLHAIALSSSIFVKDLMIAGFYVGKELISAVGVILSAYYLYKRFWRELAMVVIGFGGGGLLWLVLSTLFDRPRPDFNPPIWIIIKGGGFPSGHTLSAIVCYGFLAYVFTSKIASLFWKWGVIVLTIGIILFIGYSRLFLGDHYLTDILAGYALGIFWAGLVFTSVEVIFNKRKN